MMRTSIGAAAAFAIALAALSAGTALAQESAAETTPAKAKVADKSGSKRVCRNIVVSGSRLSSRICRTQAAWDKSMTDTQDSAFDQQNGPGYRPEQPEPSASAPR